MLTNIINLVTTIYYAIRVWLYFAIFISVMATVFSSKIEDMLSSPLAIPFVVLVSYIVAQALFVLSAMDISQVPPYKKKTGKVTIANEVMVENNANEVMVENNKEVNKAFTNTYTPRRSARKRNTAKEVTVAEEVTFATPRRSTRKKK